MINENEPIEGVEKENNNSFLFNKILFKRFMLLNLSFYYFYYLLFKTFIIFTFLETPTTLFIDFWSLMDSIT
jgi:hypothetical protein